MLAIGLQLPGERLINVSPHAVTPPFPGPAGPDLAWLPALGPTPMGTVPGLISGCAGDFGRITGWFPWRPPPVRARLGDGALPGSELSRPGDARTCRS